jgi:drug/metabolite transporter (DMT)-like permease
MIIVFSIFCGLVSMLTYGLSNVFSQPLAKKYGPAEMLFLRGVVIVVILAITAVPSYAYLTHYREVVLTLLLGMAGYLPVLAFMHGIKVSRIGIVAPISGTSPLITVLLSAFILGAVIHPLQWIAVLIVIGANVIMSIDIKNWRNSNVLQLSSGIPFALLATIGWGAFYFFLVYSTNWLGPWMSAFLVEAGVTIAAGIHLVLSSKKIQYREIVSKSIIFNSLLLCFGTVGFTIGVHYFNVGIVASLSNSTAIVSAIGATYFFHEHLTRKEKIAASVMIAGIVVLTVF